MKLMTLVEKYGRAMKELGYQNGIGFLDSPARVKAMLKAQKLEKQLEDAINAQSKDHKEGR